MAYVFPTPGFAPKNIFSFPSSSRDSSAWTRLSSASGLGRLSLMGNLRARRRGGSSSPQAVLTRFLFTPTAFLPHFDMSQAMVSQEHKEVYQWIAHGLLC